VSRLSELGALLDQVPHPEINLPLSRFVYTSELKENIAEIVFNVPSLGYPLLRVIETDVSEYLSKKGFQSRISFRESAEVCAGDLKESPRRLEALPLYRGGGSAISPIERGGINFVIPVASGKGGVGKSFVTASLATHLALLGYRVGVLDADITGPCIARMFGLHDLPKLGADNMIEPLVASFGIKVMGIDLIMDKFKTPLIWRGPMINDAIRGLFSETRWGKLHYLLVDLPPGTSDAPLTVFQSLKPDGVIFVTTPAEMAKSVVARAVKMAEILNTPTLGVVVNMSELALPGGQRLSVFGREAGDYFGLEKLGSIAIDPAVGALSDRGEIELYRNSSLYEIARKMRFSLLGKANTKEPLYWCTADENQSAL
jgi:Mrp family chromosome partitioning ATPase